MSKKQEFTVPATDQADQFWDQLQDALDDPNWVDPTEDEGSWSPLGW